MLVLRCCGVSQSVFSLANPFIPRALSFAHGDVSSFQEKKVDRKGQQETGDGRKECISSSGSPMTMTPAMADFTAKARPEAKRNAKREKEEQKKRLKDTLQVVRTWTLHACFERIEKLISTCSIVVVLAGTTTAGVAFSTAHDSFWVSSIGPPSKRVADLAGAQLRTDNVDRFFQQISVPSIFVDSRSSRTSTTLESLTYCHNKPCTMWIHARAKRLCPLDMLHRYTSNHLFSSADRTYCSFAFVL